MHNAKCHTCHWPLRYNLVIEESDQWFQLALIHIIVSETFYPYRSCTQFWRFSEFFFYFQSTSLSLNFNLNIRELSGLQHLYSLKLYKSSVYGVVCKILCCGSGPLYIQAVSRKKLKSYPIRETCSLTANHNYFNLSIKLSKTNVFIIQIYYTFRVISAISVVMSRRRKRR